MSFQKKKSVFLNILEQSTKKLDLIQEAEFNPIHLMFPKV